MTLPMLCLLLTLFLIPSLVILVESFQVSPPPMATRKLSLLDQPKTATTTPLFAAAASSDEPTPSAKENDFTTTPTRIPVPADWPKSTKQGKGGAVVATEDEDDDMPEINLLELLSTCVDAASKGCEAIRRIQRQRSDEFAAQNKTFEVEYKIDGDVRSALTAADVAAQAAIVDALTSQWPCLTIVGEEDIDVREECTLADGDSLLRKDLCYPNDAAASEIVANTTAPLDRITVFVDPLDGTREFVEGRIQNVQTLIGIAVDGLAVAGAVGLPFYGYNPQAEEDEEPSSATKIVYGLVGMGRLGVVGEKPSSSKSKSKRLVLVAGDTDDPVLMDAYQAVSLAAAARARGCDRELMGGTGTKLLAIAEGRADIAVMNFKSSRWDTCATEALVKTTGGFVTDIFGSPIVHRSEILPPDTSYLNAMGVIGSGPNKDARDIHRAVCRSMRHNAGALKNLLVGAGYGLTDEEAEEADADEAETESVTQALQKRRAIQTQGLR